MEREILHKFFQNKTTKQEDEVIRKWLKESPDNIKRLAEERKVFDLLLLNTNDREVKEAPVRLPWKEFAKIAAVFLITFLGSWYYFTQIYVDSSTAMQTIKVPAGQRLNITLPDGTDIWLNAKTIFQYPAVFNKKHRTVFLDGQAYFDVARNEKAPFTVETSFGTVEARGTAFDVLAYSDIQEYETVLINGSVAVNLKDAPDQTKILQPNYKSYLEEGELKTMPVDDLNELLWKEGLICFKNESFEKIMKSFEKIYDIKIVINNPLKRQSLYTSKFRVSDGIEYAMRVLQKDADFSYERDVDNNVITIN